MEKLKFWQLLPLPCSVSLLCVKPLLLGSLFHWFWKSDGVAHMLEREGSFQLNLLPELF